MQGIMSVPMAMVHKAYRPEVKRTQRQEGGLAALLQSKKKQFARAVARSLNLDARFAKITKIEQTGEGEGAQVQVHYAIELGVAGLRMKKKKTQIKKMIRTRRNHTLGTAKSKGKDLGKHEGEDDDSEKGMRWPSAEEIVAELETEEFQRELKSMLAKAGDAPSERKGVLVVCMRMCMCVYLFPSYHYPSGFLGGLGAGLVLPRVADPERQLQAAGAGDDAPVLGVPDPREERLPGRQLRRVGATTPR